MGSVCKQVTFLSTNEREGRSERGFQTKPMLLITTILLQSELERSAIVKVE